MPEDKQDSTEHAVQPEEVTAPAISNEHVAEEQFALPGSSPELQESPDPQGSLPPEAHDTVNGGPLGCCLGVVIGLMVSLLVAVIGRIYANPLVPIFHSALLVLILLRIAMAIGGIAGAVIFGYLGWKIGRRLYREYEPPVIDYRRYKRRNSKKAQTHV
jgi:hypothetical protein